MFKKIYEWGAVSIAIPRSLLMINMLLAIVLIIGTYARRKADQLRKEIPCMCSQGNPNFL